MQKTNDKEWKNEKEIRWGRHWLVALWLCVASFVYACVMIPEELKGGTILAVQDTHMSLIKKLDEHDSACADSSYKVFIKHEREIERLYIMMESMFQMRNDP